MKRLPLCIFVFLLLFGNQVISLSAQQKSRVAVLPFTAVDVSQSEARVVTSLFETALVKTGVYNIIEQNQISEILKAQAFSLSGCTDDACAIEVGKLLAAELIVLGEISHVGGRYIATAKLIDVGLGRNVNADSVTAATIAEMTDKAITLLAYKLAGLTYTEGGGERIADAFGELYVSTTPDGADIFINGMRRGTSPLVIDKIPLGTVRVSARKGNLSGEAVVELRNSSLVELSIPLRISLGRLFIKSSEKDVEVFLDGKSLGPLGGGLFRDIPAGEHTLVLKGNGMRWEGTVMIEADKTVTTEAYPRAFGSLSYNLPNGAVCVLREMGAGQGESRRLSGGGFLDIAVGVYLVSVSGQNYESFESKLTIERGRTTSFSPALEYTAAYKAVLAKTELERVRADFERDLSLLSSRIEIPDGGADELSGELDAARALRTRVMASGYDFPDLLKRADDLNIAAIDGRIQQLRLLIDTEERRAQKQTTGKWFCLGVGAAGFAMTAILYFVGEAEYEVYRAAITSDVSEASHDRLFMYTVLQYGGLAVGTGGILGGLSMKGVKPDTSGFTAELAGLSAERAAIAGGIR